MYKQKELKLKLNKSLYNRGYENPTNIIFYDNKSGWEVNLKNQIYSLIIIKEFNLNKYLVGLSKFLNRLNHGIEDKWFKDFTKSIIMAGNPSKLRDRYKDDKYITKDMNIMWTFPNDKKHQKYFSRLLRPINTVGKYLIEDKHKSNKTKKDFVLEIIDEINFEDFVINLNHILAEIYIKDIVKDFGRVDIKQVSEFKTVENEVLYERIALDRDKKKLKFYGRVYEK